MSIIKPNMPNKTRTSNALEIIMSRMGIPVNDQPERDDTRIANALAKIAAYYTAKDASIQSLTDTDIIYGKDETVIDVIGIPAYIEDVAEFAEYGITQTGWYVFTRVMTPAEVTITEDTTVFGADGAIATPGSDHVDLAVRFDVAAASKKVVIDWGDYESAYVFRAPDLAIRNLDYRVTFYVYDIEPFATWSYALTTDTTFAADKYYYTKDENDTYTLAEVTVDEAVPANTYYNHSKVTFSGMARNVTYRCNTIIDCPMEFILPEIEDDCHGAWFEIRCRHAGEYSMTLVPPSNDVRIATEHTQKETAGMNMINLHYTVVDGVKLWRFMNTHSTIPAATSEATTA